MAKPTAQPKVRPPPGTVERTILLLNQRAPGLPASAVQVAQGETVTPRELAELETALPLSMRALELRLSAELSRLFSL